MDKLFWERLVTVILFFIANRVRIVASVNKGVPALFTFGDSILDTGNNNNLPTLTKCNFPPYGRDFFGGIATGRFCDGRVPSDLITSALGIKQTLPAYLNPNLTNEDLPTGVGFASGGSGNDDLTCNVQGGVLTLSAQLSLFQQYIGRLRGVVGVERASYIISNALVLISQGNNDVALTQFNPLRLPLTFPVYADTLVASQSKLLQSLYGLGVRRVWVLSTLPLGCLPGARTAAGGPLRICAPFLNLQAQLFNSKLFAAVNSLRTSLPNFNIRFIDNYNPLLNLIQNPSSAGFVNVANGCCATGTVEFGGLCNLITGSCPNPSQYVFWDAAHPTQRAYEFVVSSILRSNSINYSTTFANSTANISVSH